MYKLLAAAFFIASSAQVALADLGPGDTCVSFAGPTKEKCAYGLSCCFVAHDYSVCYKGKCPKLLLEDELCSGIAGPRGECVPGTVCCPLGPDNSVCRKVCK